MVGAMNQAFFTLSTGMGGMAIFGSYIGKERSLMGEAIHVIILDSLVAFLAGVIIFPACFTYNLEVTAGPSLLFDTMAAVFNNMPAVVSGAPCSSCSWYSRHCPRYSAYAKSILAMIRELTGWSRPKGSVICGIGIFLLALTTALGFSIVHFTTLRRRVQPGWISGTSLFPIIFCRLALWCLLLFCCNKFGWAGITSLQSK